MNLNFIKKMVIIIFIVVISSIFIWPETNCRKMAEPRLYGQSGKTPVKELTAEASDVTLYVRIRGNIKSNNVLIAINGGPGMSSHYMLNIEQLSGSKFAVVTYDQRGVSRSTSPAGEVSNFTLLKYVDDLEAVRRRVGTKSIHLLGHSWGGIVAMSYAGLYPQKVRSLILVGSGPPSWKGIGKAQIALGNRLKKLNQLGLIPKNLPPGDPKAVLPAYFSDPTFWFSPDHRGEAPEFNNKVNQLTFSAIRGFDITRKVNKLSHRVLLIMGKDDPFGMPMLEEIKNALTSARVNTVLLRKCGHFWHECPVEFFRQVRSFLGLK